MVLLGAWLLLLLLLLTPISVSLFTQNPPPKTLHAKPTSKFGPQIRPVSKLRLKVDEPQIGVELRPNLVLKSGQRGQKRPFVVILNYPASMSACMCFPSFPLNRGSLAPRDRDGVTSEAEYRFNMFRLFLPHTRQQPIKWHIFIKPKSSCLRREIENNEKKEIIRKGRMRKGLL